jgi:nucleoid-associated protein YgaU
VAAPTSASTPSTTAKPGPAGTHAYTPEPASDPPEAAQANPGSGTSATPGSSTPSKEPGGGDDQGTDEQEEQTHRVVGGDNLWAIARDHLSRQRSGGSGEPTNHEVAAYWLKVVQANRDRLRSGDPDLIYPGERVTLPPVD